MKQYIRTVNACVEHKRIYGNIRGYAQFWAGKQFVCTCKGFQYNKRCKHLSEFLETICDWHESDSTDEQLIENVCPVCGGKTEKKITSLFVNE